MQNGKTRDRCMTKPGIVLIRLLVLFTLVALVMLAGGCKSEPSPQPEIAPDPFTVVWGPERDHVVTFSGNSAGHVAGRTSEFNLRLDNNSFESWKGEYIVQLLDSDGIVMEIARDTFEVPAGLEPEIVIPVEFSSRLHGPYGLSLYIPEREAQSIQTIWVGGKRTEDVRQWPSISTHPWLWPESAEFTEENSRQLAEEFVKNSPTFEFDGIEDSLELVETLYPDIEDAWSFVFHFNSRHAGYGDRTGQMLAQVITPHEVVITVEKGMVKSAVMDEKWDMLRQETLLEIE